MNEKDKQWLLELAVSEELLLFCDEEEFLQLAEAVIAAYSKRQREALKPVARLASIDEYGPRLEWFKPWTELQCGTQFYTSSTSVTPMPEPTTSSVVPTPDPDLDPHALHVGYVVAAVENSGYFLRSGSSVYDSAVVVSVDPLILVSHAADMRWKATVQAKDLRVIGVVGADELALCMTRLTNE